MPRAPARQGNGVCSKLPAAAPCWPTSGVSPTSTSPGEGARVGAGTRRGHDVCARDVHGRGVACGMHAGMRPVTTQNTLGPLTLPNGSAAPTGALKSHPRSPAGSSIVVFASGGRYCSNPQKGGGARRASRAAEGGNRQLWNSAVRHAAVPALTCVTHSTCGAVPAFFSTPKTLTAAGREHARGGRRPSGGGPVIRGLPAALELGETMPLFVRLLLPNNPEALDCEMVTHTRHTPTLHVGAHPHRPLQTRFASFAPRTATAGRPRRPASACS